MRAPVKLWICCYGDYWGMVHWLWIWNSQANFFLNHGWYVVLLKTVIDFSVMIKLSEQMKTSSQFNLIDTTYSSEFHADLDGGCLQNWSSVKKPQSQNGNAEMHHTAGRNLSYPVIIYYTLYPRLFNGTHRGFECTYCMNHSHFEPGTHWTY